MLPQLFTILTAATIPAEPLPMQAADSIELLRLEAAWNRAHVSSDTAALAGLWADDLVVAVPEMPVMSKMDLLRFWRSGRSAITRYETSDLRVRLYGDAAVVTGHLSRERNFNGRTVSDAWRFTKVYARRDGRWQVVAYHASVAAGG
jgi:ketosteroid isomerase-like protein